MDQTLQLQWQNGKRQKTVESLKRVYSDPERRKRCSEAMKAFFAKEENRKRHADRMASRNDNEEKSIRMKAFWAKPTNRKKMLSIIQSEENKTLIAVRMSLKKKGLNVVPILEKMGIPFKKRFKEAFYTFDVLLYPNSTEQILLDARKDDEEMRRTAKAKEIFVKGVMLGFRYVWLSEISEEKILGAIM